MDILEHKDAILCEIPPEHPASRSLSVQKLPVPEKMTYVEFYNRIPELKNKGQAIALLMEYMQKGERRGFINPQEYRLQIEKLREMAG